MRPLAESPSQRFSVINHDRRGRDDSGDAQPYAVEREIEDLGAPCGGRRNGCGVRPFLGSRPGSSRGGASPDWMIEGCQRIANAMPHGRLEVLDGQEHVVAPEILTPVLAAFLAD